MNSLMEAALALLVIYLTIGVGCAMATYAIIAAMVNGSDELTHDERVLLYRLRFSLSLNAMLTWPRAFIGGPKVKDKQQES